MNASIQQSDQSDMLRAAAVVTAVFMLANSPTPLYLHWQQQLGFSTGTLTVIFSLYIAGLSASLIFSGQLSDFYGRKHVLMPGLIVAAIACIFFAYADSVVMLGIGRLLTGISVGVIVSAGMAAVVDLSHPDHKRRAALLASVAMVSGAGLGPLLAGAMAEILNEPVVYVFGIELFVLCASTVVMLRLPLRSHLNEPGHTMRLRLRLPRAPAANRLHLLLGIGTFGSGLSATAFVLALGPSLLARLLNMYSPLIAGGMACALFLSATAVQFTVTRLSVRFIFFGSVIATVLAMIFLCIAVYGGYVLAFIIAALLAGAGQGLGQLGGLTLIGLHVPYNRRAEANSVLNLGAYIPAGLLPVATGYLNDYLGMNVALAIFAITLSVIVLCVGECVRRCLPDSEI